MLDLFSEELKAKACSFTLDFCKCNESSFGNSSHYNYHRERKNLQFNTALDCTSAWRRLPVSCGTFPLKNWKLYSEKDNLTSDRSLPFL